MTDLAPGPGTTAVRRRVVALAKLAFDGRGPAAAEGRRARCAIAAGAGGG